MNKKALTLGIGALMVVGAFFGVFTMAETTDVTPNNAGARVAIMMVSPGADSIEFCAADDTPQGNVTMYELPAEIPIDDGKTPEDYVGYVSSGLNGIYYNGGDPFIMKDLGSPMVDWWPAQEYVMVAECNPVAWGGHHPTAAMNYTIGTKAVWATDGEFFPAASNPLEAICPDIAVAAGTVTWTDMADPNGVITGYDIYRDGANIATVLPGVGSYVDGTPGAVYYIGIEYEGGYHTWGKSPFAYNGVDTPPVADAGPDQGVPVSTLVTFDGSASTDDNGITNYWWNFTDGTPQTLTGVGPSYTFNTGGVYVVTLEVYDTIGQKDTDTVTITVSADAVPPVADAGVDQNVDEDTVVTFDGSASSDNIGVTGYTWTFTDGILRTLMGVSPTWTFNTPGTYVVQLEVTDAATNTDTDTMTVTVADVTSPVVTDTTPSSVIPDTAFTVTAIASDYQTLVLGSAYLDYYPTDGSPEVTGVAPDSMTSVQGQITKAGPGEEPMQTTTYTWNIPAQIAGTFFYNITVDDGVNPITTEAGMTTVAVAGNNPTPHPVLGYIKTPLGVGINGAVVVVEWINNGIHYTNTTTSAVDGLGNDGWYQIDLAPANYSAGDDLWVNATFGIGIGTNYTVVIGGDNILPDDDKEYVNVTIIVEDFFELKWTLGWNIWSIPMIRSENASLGMTDLPFSWFASAHHNDTMQEASFIDDCTLVAWTGAAYITYLHPADQGGANDITVQPDYGYWAYVEEAWYMDEQALVIPEQGIFVPGQFIWRFAATRVVNMNAGWNLLGWTSFNTTFAATDVITAPIASASVSGDGIAQPEIIANWTTWDWEFGGTYDLYYEGGKDYTTYVDLGAYGQSIAAYDFPIGPGYGFWVYHENGASTLTYATQ